MLCIRQSLILRRGLSGAAGCLIAAFALAGSVEAQSSKKVFTEAELSEPPPGPNPNLSTASAGAEIPESYRRAKLAYESRLRSEREGASGATEGFSEVEPNNSQAEAQPLPDFGTGPEDSSQFIIASSIAVPTQPTPFAQVAEDDGAIPSASPTGLAPGQAVTALGTIGDGPHGTAGTRNGDFDFFQIAGVEAGQILSMDVRTFDPAGDLDPHCALWDSAGNLLDFLEDLNIESVISFDFDCRLVVEAPADGDYYFSIGGWSEDGEQASELLPRDPFDSGSGFGTASQGGYTVTLGLDAVDRDCFSFSLTPGDVLGTSTTRVDSLAARVYDPSGQLRMGSITDRTDLYPDSSPLPRGGVATNFVARQSGEHFVCFDGRPADFSAVFEVYRPALESTQSQQTFFVDFDGATFNREIFNFSPQLVTASPLSSFLENWGFTSQDEGALIDKIIETLEENLVQDLSRLSNRAFSVRILNSRDHEDPFGDPLVSRIVIGGSSEATGLLAIGIAQSVDPGNFDTEETALVQLDELSAPGGPFAFDSLNGIAIAEGASKIDLVGLALGNAASHEVGHLLGLWDAEGLFERSAPSIMDARVFLFSSQAILLELGPDGIFGTADDVDLDFAEDRFYLRERFMGFQDSAEIAAYALTTGALLFEDDFESGTAEAWSSAIP